MFYDQLKRVCVEKHTSPSAVAMACGMSKSNITGWKNGSSPKLETIVKLAAVLGVEPFQLLPNSITAPVR